MGGIGLSGNGALHVGWTRSSTTAGEFPSSYTAHQALGDTLNSLSAKELLKAGTGVYTGSRWGDPGRGPGSARQPARCGTATSGRPVRGRRRSRRSSRPARRTSPVTPVRILDTRSGPAIGLSGKFTAKVARTWQVTGVGGIPAGAVAVTGNVTVTQQEAVGFVAVTPTATNRPAVIDDQHPAQRQPGQQPDRAAVVDGHAVGRLRRRDRQEDAPHLRRDRLLPGRRHGCHLHPAGPGPRPRHPRPSQVGLAGKFANSVPRTLTITGTTASPRTRPRSPAT